LLTFFDIKGIFHYEFVPTGQTVKKVYYLEVLERLSEKVRRRLLPRWVREIYCIVTYEFVAFWINLYSRVL